MRAVIRREFDNITRDEIIQFAKLVNEAKLEELKTWQSLDCFVRMPRNKARNKVDGAWVLKWKKVRTEVNGTSTWVIIIKARLQPEASRTHRPLKKTSRPIRALHQNGLKEL